MLFKKKKKKRFMPLMLYREFTANFATEGVVMLLKAKSNAFKFITVVPAKKII